MLALLALSSLLRRLAPAHRRVLEALAGLALLSSGCAGPSTPLGAPWVVSLSDEFDGARANPLSLITNLFGRGDKSRGQPQITFSPAHQNLHGPGPLEILVHDPHGIPSNYRLIVRHNGLDVTSSFLRQATEAAVGQDLRIRVPVVRLPADRDNRIEVVYGRHTASDSPATSTVAAAYALYDPPVCHAFAPQDIVDVPGFNPSPQLLETIRKLSVEHRFNPAFTAGLIAQESGFDPRTVSWAKAIGLTQVTSAAEDEILDTDSDENEDWPRYPGINALPAPLVKALVASGHANPSNEWRLDARRSIDGGLLYLEMLAEHWTEPYNLRRIRATSTEPDLLLTQLVLASYNSGYARVAQAFARDGAAWLASPELTQARKYVNRITSYCDRFASNETVF